MTAILRKYGVEATIPFSLFEVDGIDLRVDAVYAAGDVKITKDEGAEANTTNSFTDEGSKYSIVLTATEMQAARISLIFIDQTGTKVWLDTDIEIETYGNASAQHAFDLDTAIQDVNMTQISGDSAAADNLEATYDGTGYTDDAAPATQSQVGSLSIGSAAISVQAESYVLTTGTQTVGTVASTETLDALYHTHTDSAGALDLYYQFDVGGSGTAVEVGITGYLNGSNDTILVQAYDWDGATWDTIDTRNGSNSTTPITDSLSLLVRHTGSGANLGKIRIRLYAASGLTSATVAIDQIYCSYAVVSQSVGYALGRVWVNTAIGTAGTESFVNGTADNQVLTFADALTIAGNVGLAEYNISTESTLTLAANLNDAIVYGVGYELNFGGFDCGNTHFYHASPVNGVVTAASGHVDILDSIIADVTVNESHFTNCTFTGTITLGSASGDVRIVNCRSGIAGSSTPVFDFGTSSANHDVFFANYHNGIEIKNFNATTGGGTDLLSLSGIGKLVVDSTCDGGTINLRGVWEIVDNSGSAVSFNYDENRSEIDAILVDTGTTIPASIAALPTAAEINAEVVDVMETDTHAEPASVVGATASMKDAIMWSKTLGRNKMTQTATTTLLRNDGDTSTISTSTVSDDGSTFTRGKHT